MVRIKSLLSAFTLAVYLTVFADAANAQGEFFKFPITETGVYKITAAQAAAMGAPAVDQLTVYGYGGMIPQLLDSGSLSLREVPVKEIDGELFFYLSAAADILVGDSGTNYQTHHYTDTLHYLVQTQRKPQKTIPLVDSPEAPEGLPGLLYQVIAYKNEKYNLLASGRNWYGERVFDSESITLNFDANTSPGLPLYFQGKFMAQSRSQSNFGVRINQLLDQNVTVENIPDGRYALKGKENSLAGFTEAPAKAEKIQVRLQFTTADGNGAGYLDYFVLGIPHPTHQPSTGIYYNLQRQPFVLMPSGQQEVWDVSTFHAITSISPASTIVSQANKIAVFRPDEAKPLPPWTKISMDLRDTPGFAELLIIAPQPLMAEAKRLASYKNNMGISTRVVPLMDIYDAFGYGNSDITAIRNFIAYQYHHGKMLKNVLFFGRGTFDYKNKLGGRPNLIPTYSSRSSLDPLTTYSSDDYFGFLNFGEGLWDESTEGDLALSIGIGRLPVINLQEAQNVVNKIIQYSSLGSSPGAWKRNVLFVADDGDNNIHLRDAESLASDLSARHPEMIIDKLYLDSFDQSTVDGVQQSPAAKSKLETLLDSSFLFINYIGHGNETTLMAEELFTVSDLENWPENKRLPVFVTATCEFGRHDSPFIRSGAEELLTARNKGAIALLSTTRPVFSNVNFTLNKAFIHAVLDKDQGAPRTLGDIYKDTKNNGLNGPLSRNFSLLGDPSLRLALPSLTVQARFLQQLDPAAETDTLSAFRTIRYKGSVTDPMTGAFAEDFNGIYDILVAGSPRRRSTLGDESPAITYPDGGMYVFRGTGEVKAGIFQGEIFLPTGGNDKPEERMVRFYARETAGDREAFGAKKVRIDKDPGEKISENEGPVIQILTPDTSASPSPVPVASVRLLAVLEDESGINISSPPDHRLSLRINGGEKIDISDYYHAQEGSYTRGYLDYLITGLEEGVNHVKLEVYDNLGNVTSKNFEIRVEGSLKLTIASHVAYPNPASSATHFRLSHNRPGENLSLGLKIYSLEGREIFSLTRRFLKAKPLLEDISWIFMQGKTKFPAKGAYLYVLSLKSEVDGALDRQSGKIIIQ